MSKCKKTQCENTVNKNTEEESILVDINVVRDIFFIGVLIGGITGAAAWAVKKYIIEGDRQ